MGIISILLLCCVLDIAAATCDVTTCEICKVDIDKCSTCKSGYYLSNDGTCRNCSDRCLFCSEFTRCNQCAEGSYKYTANDGNSYCPKCRTDCKSCASQTQCKTCKPGYYGIRCEQVCHDHCVGGECKIDGCTIGCVDGTYKNSDNVCWPCLTSCKTCSNGVTCDSCNASRYGSKCINECIDTCPNGTCDISTGRCATTCEEGQYLHQAGYCVACSSPCKSCITTSTLCTNCHSGYFLNTRQTCQACASGCNECKGQSTYCSSCKDGYYRWFQGCAACKAPCTTCTLTECTACKQGYHLASGQCCPSTCTTCSSPGHCTSCNPGHYLESQQCRQCLATCATCTSYPDCTSCKQGYYLELNQECRLCSSACATCTSYNNCTSCRYGYSLESQQCHQCSLECLDQQCDSNRNCINGCSSPDRFGLKCDKTCSDTLPDCLVCTATATLVQCVECKTGFYLQSDKCIPNITCPACKGGTCDSDGSCTNGCFSNDKYGQTCDKSCTHSFPNCSTCNTAAPIVHCEECITNYHLVNNSCEPNISCSLECEDHQCDSDGNCTNGCSSNDMYGPKCDKSCKDSVSNCSACNATTSPVRCVECISGYHLVNNTCEPCSLECNEKQCNSDGNCTNGCSSSDKYGPNCDKRCSSTFQHCSECNGEPVSCSACQTGYILHSGSCQGCPSDCKEGCISDDDGITCKQVEKDPFVSENSIDTNVTTIGGAVGSGFVLIALVIFLCIVIRKRREKQSPETGEAHTAFSAYETVTDPADLYSKPIKRRGNVSMSISGPVSSGKSPMVRLSTTSEGSFTGSQGNDTGTRMSEGCIAITTSPPAVLYSKPIKRKGNDSRARSGLVSFGKSPAVLDNGAHVEEEPISNNITPVIPRKQTPDMYYNMAGMIRSRVAVDQLQAFVSKKTNQDFMKEFMKLPDGLTRPYDAAMQNRENNRYRMIYPYDASRVVLKSGPTDYINASHIDCYSQYNIYIASLGPTDKIMPGYESFWTMVWQEKVEVIVMLTNLTEGAAMKCEQYWPDCGSRMTYGDVTVTCHSEDVYAEYTVRTFTVQQTERRTLHHIHYTAWPDKGVPDDVTSIIEFRQKVINFPNKLEGPTIVHCSAGIGRTGTYVALDILTREGQAEGTVDVFGCVAALRGQRVNMVQTAEQYEYLHNALVHALTFECDPIQANTVRQLLMSSHTSTMYAQFEHLNQTRDTLSEDEKAAIAGNRVLLQKNRPGADIPGNKHRSWIQTQQTASSEYINAVYVNSFKQRNRYIVAQTPLPTTVVDFLTLVIQTNCPCIVSLDEDNIHDTTVGVYLPATNQVSTLGMFQVECITCETTPNYTLRQLVITALLPSGVKEHSVYHFQCTSWGMGDNVPRDAMVFLQMTRDVERVAAGYKDTGPILVHCLTGAERSGLFCVVSVLIQKMEIEHQVSVVNTVRQVKARRRTAIPNKEQYQFCHQCLAAYIQSFETFSSIPL